MSVDLLVFDEEAPVNQAFSLRGNVFPTFTVPASGYYLITALGAQGGSVNGTSGGKGAQMQRCFLLRAGQVLRVAAGDANGGAGNNAAVTATDGGAGGTQGYRSGSSRRRAFSSPETGWVVNIG